MIFLPSVADQDRVGIGQRNELKLYETVSDWDQRKETKRPGIGVKRFVFRISWAAFLRSGARFHSTQPRQPGLSSDGKSSLSFFPSKVLPFRTELTSAGAAVSAWSSCSCMSGSMGLRQEEQGPIATVRESGLHRAFIFAWTVNQIPRRHSLPRSSSRLSPIMAHIDPTLPVMTVSSRGRSRNSADDSAPL